MNDGWIATGGPSRCPPIVHRHIWPSLGLIVMRSGHNIIDIIVYITQLYVVEINGNYRLCSESLTSRCLMADFITPVDIQLMK